VGQYRAIQVIGRPKGARYFSNQARRSSPYVVFISDSGTPSVHFATFYLIPGDA
jgi:hypothetical protein